MNHSRTVRLVVAAGAAAACGLLALLPTGADAAAAHPRSAVTHTAAAYAGQPGVVPGPLGHPGTPVPGLSVSATPGGTLAVSVPGEVVKRGRSRVTSHEVPSGSSPATATTAPAAAPPALTAAPPASSANTVLSPVPVIVPTIGGAVTQVGAQLPWDWLGVLAAVDLALLAGMVLRRRNTLLEEVYSVSLSAHAEDATTPDEEH